jgi:DNA replicative helicase MCM subunit Mcm2 (Cdc46/Mcm family)
MPVIASATDGRLQIDKYMLGREACFVCEKCGHEEMVPSQLGHLEEPLVCGNPMCREKWTMKMVHNRSTFHNKQIVKMQVHETTRYSCLLHAPWNLTAQSCGGDRC